MPFDSSGTFTRTRGRNSWVGDATASTPIKADLHDINDNDVADGLSNVLTKNGVTQPTADIPLAGHKLINVGQPANPQDAATKKYVDELPGWPTAKNISGSDANGRLNFTSLTGVNGITWSSIDAAWVAKKADSSGQKERDRVVLNNKADCTGSDVVAIDDADGSMQWPGQTEMRQNLVFDGVSYRTPAAGTGGLWRKAASGLSMLANSVATTLAYGVATLETWFNLSYTSGNVALTLNKKASGNQNALSGQMNGVARWIALFGNTTAEVADNSGSDFSLTAYTNAGVAVGPAMIAFRKTAKVQFPQGHQGEFQADAVNTDQVYSDAGLTLGATNLSIYIRPVAYNSTSHQSVFNNLGDLTLDRYLICNGISECAGTGGTPNAGQIFNFDYVDSTHINVYVGTTIVGHITPGASFDARGMIDDLMARVAALEARP